MNFITAAKTFVAVVECGSYIKASKLLGLSRPMASKHVRDLENEFGLQLLNRTTRSLALTEAGQIQYERCLDILKQVEQAYHQAGSMQSEPSGVLRLNAPISFGYQHLTPAIVEYQSRYPKVSVELTLNDRFVNLVDEGYDMAIRIGQLRDSDLICRRLAQSRMLFCATPNYLKTHGALSSPNDLLNHNCLVYSFFSQGSNWRFGEGRTAKIVSVEGAFQSNSGEAILTATLNHAGIALLPDFLVGSYIKEGRLVQILDREEKSVLDIHVIFPANRFLPLKIRSFVDFLKTYIGEDPYWI